MTKTSFKWLGILIYIRIHVYGVEARLQTFNNFPFAPPPPQPQTFNNFPSAPRPPQPVIEEGSVATPIPSFCQRRTKLWQFNGHYYNIVDTSHEWLAARNICRKQCMDAVAIETEDEANMIAYVITLVGSYDAKFSTWTSGRRCDFKQCKDSHGNYLSYLLPLNVNGWFWAGTKKSIPPTNKSTWTQNPWSQVGKYGEYRPQPDNGEFQNLQRFGGILDEEDVESCLAVLNVYQGNGDGVKWHDIACYHRYPVICEDDDVLINYVKYYNPHLNL